MMRKDIEEPKECRTAIRPFSVVISMKSNGRDGDRTGSAILRELVITVTVEQLES